MNASLNKKLRAVKWGEYKLGTLFDIENTLSFNVDKLVDGIEYDYVTRTSINQGVLQTTGFVNESNINASGTWSLGLLSMDFFYRRKPWYAGQFVRKIIPNVSIPERAVPFFSTILNKQKPILLSVLVRSVDETFKNTSIKLPETADGKIDFDFMESFIAELEAERVAELSAYLTVSGLDNYELSEEEETAIEEYQCCSESWSKYRIGDLFERVSTNKLPYKANDLPKQPTGEYILPCLTSSFQNQGLNYYVPKDGAKILKNVISIPSNSDVYRAYYQSREFTVLSDAYAIQWTSSAVELSPKQYLFMVMCINKITNLPIYSYKNKLGGWNVVKNIMISLPEKDGKIDFDYMEVLISAIRKLVIKDVVLYTNRKVSAAKKITKKKES